MIRPLIEQVKQTVRPFSERTRKLQDDLELARRSEDVQGQVKALRKLARIFLETFQPAQARQALDQLALLKPNSAWLARARRLCDLLEGQVQTAEQGAKIPFEPVADLRYLVRTGQLETARKRLECRQPSPFRVSADLETDLLGAYLAACQGYPELAEQLAAEALERGLEKACGWTIALGFCRLGHAKAICGQAKRAAEHYQESLAFSRLLELPRLEAEPLMGLALLAISHGNGEEALELGQEAARCLSDSGDRWALTKVNLVIAVGRLLSGAAAQARSELSICCQTFRESRDSHLECATLLWLAQAQPEQQERLHREVESGHHAYLLERCTLYAPRTNADEILNLKVLGRLRALRGGRESDPVLPRRKSVELLGLLVSRAGRWVEREELLDLLWPDHSPQTARRDLSVALHHVASLLSPRRQRRSHGHGLERLGTAYRFVTDWRVRVDATNFEDLLKQAERCRDDRLRASLWQEALALYDGPYLQEILAPWALIERDRLHGLALRTLERLGLYQLEENDIDAAEATAAEILRWDHAWEPAFRIQILAHLKADRLPQAINVYRRCQQVLKQEYDLTPSPEMARLVSEAIEQRSR